MTDNQKLSLLVTEEQRNTIRHLFEHYEWEFNEANSTQDNACVNQSTQTNEDENADSQDNQPGMEDENRFIIQHDQDCAECPFCFCKPCITNERNKQLWWEDNSQPRHQRNHSLRKEKYKYFWTMMYHRDVWRDDRYQLRKRQALDRDPKFRNYIYHKRDIMPNCVLKLVRGWHPNPENVPYMGHLWE